VTSEDYDTMNKNSKFYEVMQKEVATKKREIRVDIR
jgi:hypothetical protein